MRRRVLGERGWRRAGRTTRSPRNGSVGDLGRGRRQRALAVSIAALLLVAHTARAQVAVGTLDDFQDGTTQGWVANLGFAIPPFPPVVLADAGPMGAGDFALHLTATGAAFGAGSKLVVNNIDPRWVGDYPASGVTGVVVDVNNLNPFPLTIRLGISEPLGTSIGGRWVTQGVIMPPMSGWVELEFSLAPEDLLPGEPLAMNVDATLGNVGILRILHSTLPSFSGDPIAAELDVDNIEAVPEPGVAALLATGALWIARLRSRRR